MNLHQYWKIIAAFLAILPGVGARVLGARMDPAAMALLSGTAILGASFLLLWACGAAQADISQSLALAVVALIAVLPEYAVDMYFTWQAGRDPGGAYARYAVANMTGANRLLIGIAWGVLAAICGIRTGRAIRLGHERRLELVFLGAATLYAFAIPLKGSLAWYDGVVFLGLYGWYIKRAGDPASSARPRARPRSSFACLRPGAASRRPFCSPVQSGRFYGTRSRSAKASSVLYLTVAATLFLQRPRVLRRLWESARHGDGPPQPAGSNEADGSPQLGIPEPRTPHCLKCPWRLSGIRAVASEIRPGAGHRI